MSISNAGVQPDSWGSTAATGSVMRRVSPATEVVRDDWDNDDDDDDAEEEDPQKLWEEANNRAPMPELVIAGSSTSGMNAVSPPPGAFQPALRILKRPNTTSPPPTSTPSSNSSQASNSYTARESRYQAARERIFGETTPPLSEAETAESAPKSNPLPVQVTRAPKGPPAAHSSDGQSSDSRGFGGRRGKKRGGEKA